MWKLPHAAAVIASSAHALGAPPARILRLCLVSLPSLTLDTASLPQSELRLFGDPTAMRSRPTPRAGAEALSQPDVGGCRRQFLDANVSHRPSHLGTGPWPGSACGRAPRRIRVEDPVTQRATLPLGLPRAGVSALNNLALAAISSLRAVTDASACPNA